MGQCIGLEGASVRFNEIRPTIWSHKNCILVMRGEQEKLGKGRRILDDGDGWGSLPSCLLGEELYAPPLDSGIALEYLQSLCL